MTDLSKMTLTELANAYWIDGPPTHAEFWAELARRQRMLDAAEELYKRIIESDDLADAAAWFAGEYAFIAYQAAKETL
jgi:hypothetical protein